MISPHYDRFIASLLAAPAFSPELSQYCDSIEQLGSGPAQQVAKVLRGLSFDAVALSADPTRGIQDLVTALLGGPADAVKGGQRRWFGLLGKAPKPTDPGALRDQLASQIVTLNTCRDAALRQVVTLDRQREALSAAAESLERELGKLAEFDARLEQAVAGMDAVKARQLTGDALHPLRARREALVVQLAAAMQALSALVLLRGNATRLAETVQASLRTLADLQAGMRAMAAAEARRTEAAREIARLDGAVRSLDGAAGPRSSNRIDAAEPASGAGDLDRFARALAGVRAALSDLEGERRRLDSLVQSSTPPGSA